AVFHEWTAAVADSARRVVRDHVVADHVARIDDGRRGWRASLLRERRAAERRQDEDRPGGEARVAATSEITFRSSAGSADLDRPDRFAVARHDCRMLRKARHGHPRRLEIVPDI